MLCVLKSSKVLRIIKNEIINSYVYDEKLENIDIEDIYYTENGSDCTLDELKWIVNNLSKQFNIKVLNSNYSNIRVIEPTETNVKKRLNTLELANILYLVKKRSRYTDFNSIYRYGNNVYLNKNILIYEGVGDTDCKQVINAINEII